MRPVRRGCTKQLRRLLAESGCPEYLRDSVPVLRDDEGVFFLYGCGCDERCSDAAGSPAGYFVFEFSRYSPAGE